MRANNREDHHWQQRHYGGSPCGVTAGHPLVASLAVVRPGPVEDDSLAGGRGDWPAADIKAQIPPYIQLIADGPVQAG